MRKVCVGLQIEIIATVECMCEGSALIQAIDGGPWLKTEFLDGAWRVVCHVADLLKTDAEFKHRQENCWTGEMQIQAMIGSKAAEFFFGDTAHDSDREPALLN